MFSWGDLGALCQDEARSLVKGNCAAATVARLQPLLGPRAERMGRAGRAQPGRQHHRRLVARRPAGRLDQPGGRLLVPGADGDQAGLAVGRAAWLDRHQSGLRLPDAAAQGRGAAGRLHQGRLGPRRRRGLSRRLRRPPSTPPPCCPTCASAARPAYWSVLDSELAAALGGRKTAQEALDATAAAWDEITDQLGPRASNATRSKGHRLRAGPVLSVGIARPWPATAGRSTATDLRATVPHRGRLGGRACAAWPDPPARLAGGWRVARLVRRHPARLVRRSACAARTVR